MNRRKAEPGWVRSRFFDTMKAFRRIRVKKYPAEALKGRQREAEEKKVKSSANVQFLENKVMK